MSDRYSNSTKSKAFKYGNNKTHELAKEAVKCALKTRKFETFQTSEAKFRINWFLSDEYEKEFICKGSYIHNYDIFANKHVFKGLFTEIFIEIDGMSLHSKPHQKKRDRIAEEFARFFFPDTYFIRIDKTDIIGKFNKTTMNDEELIKYINIKIRDKYKIRKDVV